MIPWRRPLPASGDGFRWSNPNLAGGEEFPRAVRILAYPLLFFVAEGLRSEGWEWLNSGWNLTGLAGLIMLYVLAWELHGHQRQRRWILPSVMRHPMFRVVASTAVLAAVWYVLGPGRVAETPCRSPVLCLMLLSVPVYSRTPLRAVAAESLALLGVIAAGELLWLAPALVVVFAAWILDYQLWAHALGRRAKPFACCRSFLALLLPAAGDCLRGSDWREARGARISVAHILGRDAGSKLETGRRK